MKFKHLFLLALILTCSWGCCDEKTEQKTQSQEVSMNHMIEHQHEKLFIGLELRTNNEECSMAMPAHKDRFFKEDTLSKITLFFC